MKTNTLTKIFKFTFCLVICTLGLGLSASAEDPTITVFDVPGAGTDPDQGTFPQGINPTGDIVGFIKDAGVRSGTARRGFVRDKDGTSTVFDAPGAGTDDFEGTRAYSINPGGAITGWFIESGGVVHGYVRAKNGTFTVFDAGPPGPYPQGTFPYGFTMINPEGAITGYYTDADTVNHGFVRAQGGTITAFDVLGAGMGPFQGTAPLGINPEGAITGFYADSGDVSHGFLRDKNGTITSPIDVPGAGTGAFQGTFPQSITPDSSITGNYVDGSDVNHGFLRDRNGTITTFDVPGAGTDAGQGTAPFAIAPDGAITGLYFDYSNVSHGFLRSQ